MLDKPAAFYRRIIRENPDLIRPLTEEEKDARLLSLGLKAPEPPVYDSVDELPTQMALPTQKAESPEKMDPSEKWLSRDEAVEYLGSGATTLDRYVRRGKIKRCFVNIRQRHRVFYALSTLDNARALIRHRSKTRKETSSHG